MAQTEEEGGLSQSEKDLLMIADFQCFDIPQFTAKVMQGVANKSLLAMSRHTRKSKAQEAEDLYLLDEI